eukprot:2609311-Rhodomonas_salina.1
MARACWNAGTGTFSAQCATWQSSTFGAGWEASKAVDATTACTHTAGAGSTNPWWRVDLGTAMPVHRLLIWNRVGCCEDRLNCFEVWVTDSTSVQRVPSSQTRLCVATHTRTPLLPVRQPRLKSIVTSPGVTSGFAYQ